MDRPEVEPEAQLGFAAGEPRHALLQLGPPEVRMRAGNVRGDEGAARGRGRSNARFSVGGARIGGRRAGVDGSGGGAASSLPQLA